METEIQAFLRRILSSAVRHPETVETTTWGRTRRFVRFDLFDDTFIVEDGLWDRFENKDPIVLVPKDALAPAADDATARVFGNVLTFSSGNHAVAAMPLVDGRFWGLSTLPPEAQTDVFTKRFVCANVVRDTIELSQRSVSTADLSEMDEWLQALGLPMRRIVLADRVDETIEAYAQRGQEWRIRPLAWTREEMQEVIRSSLARIHTHLRYYHNVRGVHYLTYRAFLAWGALMETDFAAFRAGLAELVGTSPEQPICNVLLPKFRTGHEIEFFGIPADTGESQLVPPLRELFARLANANAIDPGLLTEARDRFESIAETFRALLTDPDFLDEESVRFQEALYRCLSGAVYHDEHGLLSRAFDDLRTALPGATYTLGNRYAHEGADPRTLAILSHLESSISHGDRIQYANVYELRSVTDRVPLGQGKTREVVYKTMWSPLPFRMVEKRLASRSTGYGAYTLARTEAFRALGISYGRHRLIARSDGASGDVHYFVRMRYPGDPFNQLPPARFRRLDPATGAYDDGESADIVRAVLVLMGAAAAENLILKKYTKEHTARFAEGKEILEFGYDIRYGLEMPLRMHLCSARGTMGWPDISKTDENLDRAFAFYLPVYARVAADYAAKHPVVDAYSLADAFWEGFSSRTRAIAWNYSSRRELFDAYNPRVFGDFDFPGKWSFALWALERQRDRLPELADLFHERFSALARPTDGEDTPTPA